MSIASIGTRVAESRQAHLATLAEIRNRPGGSLHSIPVDPAVRVRTAADFDRLDRRHATRPEPWIRYVMPRLKVERAFTGLGVNPDRYRPWHNADGSLVKTSDLVTVIKQVRRSRDPGLVHPHVPTIDDGDVIAIFPTALEKKLRPGKKLIGEATDALDYGALTGNHMAWGKGTVSLAAGRLKSRFYSMKKGAAEGFGDPRMMGRIMCNLGLTSVGITGVLYFAIYMANCAETRKALRQEPAIQPVATASQSGTYALSA